MIELSRHIEILLLDNDCVIVPGLGGFMAHYVSAQVVEEENVLYPPYRSIGFNPQLQLNDSLLTQSYVEAYDMSYPEAVRRISAEVDEIKHVMDVEGSYEFNGIGVLEKTSDDCYDFHPSASGLLTPSLYALNTFVISEIEHSVDTLNVEIKPLSEARKIDFSAFKTVALAAVMLLLFILSSIPVGTGSGSIQQCSIVNTEALSKLIKSTKPNLQLLQVNDTVNLEAAKPEAHEQSSNILQDTVKVVKDKQLDGQHYYVLVVAARVSKSGAKDLVNKLKQCGFTDTNISERTSNRKVIYGHYKTEDEALNALRTLRTQEITFTDAWISRI